MCCNEEPYGPKARRARCIAIGALVLAIVGLVAIVAHRLYGLFACIGSALSLIAPSMLLCDGRSSKSMFKGAANTAFMSATVSFAGFLMIIYGLSGISSFYDNCKRQVCVEPKYSYYKKREVPGWQTAICDNMHGRQARDCYSMSDCLSDQSVDLYCSYGLYELEGAVFWAVVATIPTLANIFLQLALGCACLSASHELEAPAPAPAQRQNAVPVGTAIPAAVAVGTPIPAAMPMAVPTAVPTAVPAAAYPL